MATREHRYDAAIMKVAAWQAPLAVRDPAEVVARLRTQVERCEAGGVEVLCCPETVLGGLADGSPDPARYAHDDGELLERLAPAASTSVTILVGYAERPAHDPRGWDGARNPTVARAFLRRWDPPR